MSSRRRRRSPASSCAKQSPIASNWRASGTLRDYLIANNVVAIADIDTRELTRLLRSAGVMRGVIATGDVDDERARRAGARDSATWKAPISCATSPASRRSTGRRGSRQAGGEGDSRSGARAADALEAAAARGGVRLRHQMEHPAAAARPTAARCAWFPRRRPRQRCWRSGVDGIFLSNGPGDPAAVDYAIENTRELAQADKPIFGICLGHQILGLALGGKTFKLKFGHRGANHPVKFLETGKVEITSQNHGFAVDPESLPSDVKVTHLNLYDGTVEGLRVIDRPIYSVQYHPEASPGPHDADYLFKQFVDDMEKAT